MPTRLTLWTLSSLESAYLAQPQDQLHLNARQEETSNKNDRQQLPTEILKTGTARTVDFKITAAMESNVAIIMLEGMSLRNSCCSRQTSLVGIVWETGRTQFLSRRKRIQMFRPRETQRNKCYPHSYLTRSQHLKSTQGRARKSVHRLKPRMLKRQCRQMMHISFLWKLSPLLTKFLIRNKKCKSVRK
jgi:hypothetical protein